MPVRIAARSYGAVDTILTGIGTFSERFWERILSADPANIDVVLELLVQRLDAPSSYAALRRSARRLSPAATFLPPIRRTSATRRVSTRYFFVVLFTPVLEQLVPVVQRVLGVVVHAHLLVLLQLPAVVLRHW